MNLLAISYFVSFIFWSTEAATKANSLNECNQALFHHIKDLLNIVHDMIRRDERVRSAVDYLKEGNFIESLRPLKKSAPYMQMMRVLNSHVTILNLFYRFCGARLLGAHPPEIINLAPSFEGLVMNSIFQAKVHDIEKVLLAGEQMLRDQSLKINNSAQTIEECLSQMAVAPVTFQMKGLMRTMGINVNYFGNLLVRILKFQVIVDEAMKMEP